MTKGYSPKQKIFLCSLLKQLREGLNDSENLRWEPSDHYSYLEVFIIKPQLFRKYGLMAIPILFDTDFNIIYSTGKSPKCVGIYIKDYCKTRKAYDCHGIGIEEFLKNVLPQIIAGWEKQLLRK